MFKDRIFPKIWFAWIVLVAGLLATVYGSLQVKQSLEQKAAREFAFVCDQVTLLIQEHLDTYSLVLRGGKALFAASKVVERQEWQDYIKELRADQNILGVQGIGFAQVIPADRLATHIADIRSEGFSEYTVFPAGARPIYTPAIYIEPFHDRNLRAFGFDMFSDPVRRAAMEQARDTGEAALSGKIELVQETGAGVQAGVLMYAPVYRNDMPRDTVEQKRAALSGWIFNAYRMNHFMGGILRDWVINESEPVDLNIYDGLQATPDTLLYDSIPAHLPDVHSLFYKLRTIYFNGHQWLLVFDRTSAALSVIRYASAWLVLLGGLSLSGLLFGLMLSVFKTRATAIRIADNLTKEIRQHQELLQESEFRWKFAIEGPGDGLLDWNLAGNTVFFSKSWKDMLGFAEDEIGNRLEELTKRIHPEDTAKANTTIQDYLDGKTPNYVSEYRVRCKDGSYKWLLDRGMIVSRDADGKPLRMIGTHRDITERKLLEAEREEALNRLQKITSRVPGIVYQYRMRPDGSSCMPFASEAICEIYRVSPEEVREDASNIFAVVHPEDYYRVVASIRKSAQDLIPWRLEYRVKYDDGAVRWLFGDALPEREADGSILWHGFITDITERKTSEAALAESRELLQTIIDTVPIRVFWKDLNLHFLGCNRAVARDAGMAHPVDLIGKDDYQMAWAAQAELYRADDKAVLESDIAKLSYDEPQTTPNGQPIWLRTSKVPLKNQDDEVIGLLGIYEDITERKRAEDVLRKLSTAVEQSPVSIVITDNTGAIEYVNPKFTEITGYTFAEALGQNPRVLKSGEVAQEVYKGLWNTILSGEVWRGVFHNKKKNGELFWEQASISPIRDDRGAITSFVAVKEDITERKQSEDKLYLAASVFTHAREGIMITGPDGTIIDVNDAFSRITGYSRDEVLGSKPSILCADSRNNVFYTAIWRDLTEKDHWHGEVWNRRKDGEIYAVMQTISAVPDSEGNTQQYVALFSDITSIKEYEKRLEHIAHYDALTGLPNRVLLADRLRQGMVQSRRRGQRLAVAFLDLDGFKTINDNHGHDAGDQLLITVASRMEQNLRKGDTLGRLGGDEFVAVLPDLANIETSVPLLTRLLAAAAEPMKAGDLEIQVSASLGVTFYPQAADIDADQLLRQADQAMYQAKLAGKNRYHIFDSDQDNRALSHYESLESIRSALTAREFVLHYQPKVNMRTGAMIGVEALIRWHHPEKGLLPPAAFLPVIEDHPLAVELGEWVIDNVLLQMELWQAAGLKIPVSINIGARQLQQVNFVERLSALLAAHPAVSTGDLELEVLETSAIGDLAKVSQVIDAGREMGVRFSLDDFGTGYSSLTYLKRLPVSQLKIGQRFVRGMLENPDDLAILEGVVGLGAAFHHQVIAEGVETVEHGEMLLKFGCELAQGYGIARPMPANQLPDWLATWQPDPAWVNSPFVNRDDLISDSSGASVTSDR